MAGIYLDTSAIGRVLLAKPDAAAIRSVPDQQDDWWSSELVVVELRRFVTRENLMHPAEKLLKEIDLLSIDSDTLQRASRVEPSEVRSLDAIHLDAAIRLKEQGKIGSVLTYDHQLQAGCRHHGLNVTAPTPTR
jgi:predicted nucleic acid-binding protein